MNFEKVDVHEKALSLPAQPGVYLMLDKNHEVIYVGKAKKLINRVSSYFRENPNHNYKTQVMVKQVWDFDYIVTDTEFEALVLENSLIKRHMPKYNILLKDDKGYPFIRLGIRDEYPNFSIVSKPLNDKARYFGPYSSRGYSKQAIEAVRVALGLPSCSRKFPRDIGKGRPCLNYHLGKCSAVCSGKVSREEYQAMIDRAVMIFEGKLDQIVEDMKRRMDKHAENLEFEQAAKLRDQISAISRLGVRQKVMSGMLSDTDVLALYTGASKTAFAVLHYIEGALLESEVHLMDTPVHTDRAGLMDGFLKQYYMPRKVFPKNIYVSDAPEDLELLEQWLSEIGGARVYIAAPQRGDKLKMVEMAGENARQKVLLSESKEEIANRAITDLQKLLGLSEPPRRVESYDISNTAGKEIVGSMVVYQDGEPRRRDYRRFQIKSLADQDDCAAMREMLERRMLRMQAGDEKFYRPARPDFARRRQDADQRCVAAVPIHGHCRSRVRHGQGRPAQDPGDRQPRRRGNRHPGQSCGVPDGGQYPGGGSPVCHRVPPKAPGGRDVPLQPGGDPRCRKGSGRRAAAGLQEPYKNKKCVCRGAHGRGAKRCGRPRICPFPSAEPERGDRGCE